MTPLAYLASPYARYPGGIHRAYVDICSIAGHLLSAGVLLYSPIASCHGLALYADLDPKAHKIWEGINRAMMERCDTLIVAHMPGWMESSGMWSEIRAFEAAGKPIFDLDVTTLLMTKRQPKENSPDVDQVGMEL